MYDYVNSNALGFGPDSVFDVFFEVNNPADRADYIVRIGQGANNFQAFERPQGSPAPRNPDGSFDLGPGSGWTALSAADLALAQFKTATGFGASPDLATNHLMAEFSLSIDNNGSPGRIGGDGIYSPDPAFWSASVKGVNDPPISSGIFVLNPNGSTGVTPVMGPNGGPISTPLAVPEPSTLWLFAVGFLLAGGGLRRWLGAEVSGAVRAGAFIG